MNDENGTLTDVMLRTLFAGMFTKSSNLALILGFHLFSTNISASASYYLAV